MADGFNPKGIWASQGRAFSQGVIQGPGGVIHLTGQVAWDEHSNVVGIGDAEAQMEKSIDNVRAILRAVGGTLDDPALAFVSASLPRRAAGAGH